MRFSQLSPTEKYLEEFRAKAKSITDDAYLEEQKLVNLQIQKSKEE
jgi:hypothetical protein